MIIGGGIAGILTAYFLRLAGIDCILLEKGRICHGTTAGTTAKITFQHGLIYYDLLKNEGLETAKGYFEANRLAFKMFEKLCGNIECDYELRDSYVYSLDNKGKLDSEFSTLQKIGCNAELCETIELPFNTAGAIRFPAQAQFHPLKFISAIADGLPIYENSFVHELSGNTAFTDDFHIKAKQIIITAHFPFINKHGSYFLKLYQQRSYVLALKNAQDINGMYVDESGTGLSFRNYNNYLLLGGGGHRTGKSGGNWAELRNFAKKYYPNSREVCSWSAQDCMSLDKIPYIGHYSSHTSRLFTASGFNKWGMTGSMLSAMLLSDMIQGKTDRTAKIFSPSRSIIKPQLFINICEATKNLLTITNKRCPHLGCALKRNNAEHSWDCPCHGSRFDENGILLNNPANKNLK